jgi:hypothetical protein
MATAKAKAVEVKVEVKPEVKPPRLGVGLGFWGLAGDHLSPAAKTVPSSAKVVVDEPGKVVVPGAAGEPVAQGEGAVDPGGKGRGKRESESVSLDTLERLGKVFRASPGAAPERAERSVSRKRRDVAPKPPDEGEGDGDEGDGGGDEGEDT